ncbi:STAS domain-containing protein [Dactylosporangium cerinum]|uniref:STAS domain-containing protein n=1 Tax=Dactylosporangium cerinum TaxID=1434730 RepID=A0ABV9VT75_9ACTN
MLRFDLWTRAAGRVVVALQGQLDDAGIDVFHQAFAAALTVYPSDLVFDLTEVTSADAAALAVLVTACRIAQRIGCRIALSNPDSGIAERLRHRGLAADLISGQSPADGQGSGGPRRG